MSSGISCPCCSQILLLLADPDGTCYKALGFHPGFASQASFSPHLKLLVMLAGFGSPGTIQEVPCPYNLLFHFTHL